MRERWDFARVERWSSSRRLRTFWSGFWRFFLTAPWGIGTALFRVLAVLLIPPTAVGSFFVFAWVLGSEAMGPRPVRLIVGAVLWLLLFVLATWALARACLAAAAFTLLGAAESAQLDEGSGPRRSPEARMEQLLELARKAARDVRAERDGRSTELVLWTRPEPPPGSVLGPRRLEGDRTPPRPSAS